MNANFLYLINQVNANAAKNGANSSITSLSALSTPLIPAQGGSNIFVGTTSTGTANVQVVAAAVPAGYTLTYGNTVRFVAGFTNTGATTLAVNGTVATAVTRQTQLGNAALIGGEIVAGQIIEVMYDGVQYELLQTSAQSGGYGPLTTLAVGATTDLGTVPSHLVSITGVATTITSFGSSASTAFPLYTVQFNAAHTLTNSATLNILGGGNRVTSAQDRGLYLYNGAGTWYELAYYPAQPKFAPTQANALTVKNNAVTPNTQVDITAAEIVMDNGSGGNYYTDSYGTCTINMTVVGAGGIDAGAIAASTWYHMYAISNGSTLSCLASTSATAPTLPAGYVYKIRVGAMQTTAGSIFYRTLQKGNHTRYVATAGATPTTPGVQRTTLAPGVCSATSTWAAIALATLVPPTAVSVDVGLAPGSNNAALQANNASPNYVDAPLSWSGTAVSSTIATNLILESTNVYWCGTGTPTASFYGWVDAINAS